MAHTQRHPIWKASGIILINIVIVITLFLVIEGLSSSIIVARKAFFDDTIAERRHTQYDEELGWINMPNLSMEMYGGKPFITNSMSFRNDKEFDFSVPENKVRIICSGDSFTMGYGVGNDDAWCQRLETINSRIETVNLGQGGYGVDQAYLWYKRNNPKLAHDIQIFAYISTDIKRMLSDTFLGYGKPFLVLEDDVLVNKNEPVPKQAYSMPRLPKIQQELKQLNTVQLLKKLSSKKGPTEKGPAGASNKPAIAPENSQQTRELVVKILRNLKEMNKAKDSTLVIVHLPTRSDYMDDRSKEWRQFLHSEAMSKEFIFIDLVEEFRKYPPQEVASLFDDHYSEKGNAYIANILYEKLLAVPEIADKLQGSD